MTWAASGWEAMSANDLFHPLYVSLAHQGRGRFDNPRLYAALYVARTPEAAIGEVFADRTIWYETELTRQVSGHQRVLATIEVPDSLPVLDLDDGSVLHDWGVRPSDVVRRNRDGSNEVAQRVWRSRTKTGYAGLQWWSYWRPEWRPIILWSDGLDEPWFPFASVVDVEPLAKDLPAVLTAADVLPREIL